MDPEEHGDPRVVIIVEDNDADAALIAAYLRHSTHSTHITYCSERAATLEAAVHLLGAPHDCVLLDLSLPDAVGLEIVDVVRNMSPAAAIVVLTGRDDDEIGRDALGHGAQDYLTKSDLSPGMLRRAVGHAIERQRQRVELLRVQDELAQEIRARADAQRDALLAHQRTAALIEHSSDLIVVLDPSGTIRSASPAAVPMLGWEPATWTGHPASALVEHAQRPIVAAALAEAMAQARSVVRMEVALRRRDGSYAQVEVVATNCVDNPAVEGIILNIRDITERKQAEDLLRHQTLHDPLTGLGNRLLLRDRVQLALDRRPRRGREVALMFIDLDGFKAVNDTFGHDAGDRLLMETAGRIRAAVRPEDTVVRLGGDEFVVLAEDLATPAEAALIAERVRDALAKDYRDGDISLQPRASVGIAIASEVACSVDRLVSDADHAMYAEKQRARTAATGIKTPLLTRP